MQNIYRYGLLLTAVVIFTSTKLSAQYNNTFYFMKGVPQSYLVNPAFQPDCSFFLGLPGLSPLQVQAGNRSFSLGDVLTYNNETGMLITPFHPDGNKQAFLALIRDRNSFEYQVSTSILSFGSLVSEGTYFNFDVRERVTGNVSLPGDLLRFPVFGPDSAMTYDFNGLGIDMNAFSEFSLGISQKIGDRLSVGLKGKVLFGQANLRTKKTDFVFTSNEDAWPVHSNIELDAAVPFVNVVYDENGMIDFDKSGLRDNLEKDIPRLAINPRNFGLAMDVGVDFRALDWLQLSASLVDFGRIKWKDGVHNLKNNVDYEFLGIKIDPDDDDIMQSFADSLDETFNNFTATEEGYSTWLPSKLYAGAAFYVHPKISFGILSGTSFYNGDVRQQFTLSANLYPVKLISTTFSYSVIDGTYKNIGFGLALKGGPFNMYLVSDTGPSVYFWPLDTRYINLKIGFNLVFGCRKQKKTYDMPLVD
ncbi:MAG TPA: DUF5723 family protein [Bacteroidales bacterium]|nr:DUF5723 family protein [Bacteroidales bacterium]